MYAVRSLEMQLLKTEVAGAYELFLQASAMKVLR